jgi:hypothetical protein
MNRKLRIFAGCTEFGSEVQAFKDRGHEIITLGIDGDVTIKFDIRKYFPSINDKYDFMWFSPPCDQFSIAGVRWRGSCKKNKNDMSIVDACFRIVNTCKPKYWIIENPAYGLRQIIGHPKMTIKYSDFGYIAKKPTDFWGNIPKNFLRYKTPTPKNKLLDFQYIKALPNLTMKQIRSIVPYNLGLSLCYALEHDILNLSHIKINGQIHFDENL